MTRTILAIALIVFVFTVGNAAASSPSPDPIPRCAEDQVLVGDGDFEAGRYERYICGPAADDFGWPL